MVHGGVPASEREELKMLCDDKFIDMSHVGRNFAVVEDRDLSKLDPGTNLENLAAGKQLRRVRCLPLVGEPAASEAAASDEDMSKVEEEEEEEEEVLRSAKKPRIEEHAVAAERAEL